MLSILSIQYFLAVVENGGITKAAQRLHVSQPAVSKQISLLEQELKTKLFYRSDGALKLTESGDIYYNFFASSRKKLGQIQSNLMGSTSPIQLGYLNKWAISDMLELFASEIKKEFPEKEISCSPWDADTIFSGFSSESVDMVLCKQSVLSMNNDSPSLNIYPVAEIPAVIAYRDLGTDDTKFKDVKDFEKVTFCSVSPRSPIIHSKITEEVCSFYDIHPEIINVPTIDAVILYLKKNPSAVTVIDTWSAQTDPNLSYFVTDIKMTVSLVWPASGKNAEYSLIAQRLKKFLAANL